MKYYKPKFMINLFGVQFKAKRKRPTRKEKTLQDLLLVSSMVSSSAHLCPVHFQFPELIRSAILLICNQRYKVVCSQCKGSKINWEDPFNRQIKAGDSCWLCGGRKEMLCGISNGAGFIGGSMSTFDE
ncbi:hypothetical protein SAY87_006698 [Trapa incisa]|uniref:BSD2 cysteine rich domain-containing protein n=1 Tax=Trapa incisa TaxID=236973 RepID=A0AAN7PZA3_9MYRT|nr:hypothetical protein SAY87_006698 [Trapa incisa]